MFKYILLYSLAIVLGLQSFPTVKVDDLDSHLSEYAAVNETHHDNIADEVHSHTHRHSEGEEEHEHRHGHTKVQTPDIQFIAQNSLHLIKLIVRNWNLGFLEKSFFSIAYPLSVFRPPII